MVLKTLVRAFRNDGSEKGSMLELFSQKIYNYVIYERHSCKPRLTKVEPGELEFILPAPGLRKKDIYMSISPKNRFSLVGRNDETPLIKNFIDLPRDASFENEAIKTTLDKGLVRVSIKDFERKERNVILDAIFPSRRLSRIITFNNKDKENPSYSS